MKIYCINLERAPQRRKFMDDQFMKRKLTVDFVNAFDGRQMSAAELAEVSDKAAVESSPRWLTPGAIACVLSHRECYRRLIDSDEKCALILEDDVVLDENIAIVLDEAAQQIKPDEVILLYFQSFKTIEFSEINAVSLAMNHKLCYPVNFEHMGAAGAYIISRETALRLFHEIIPICVAADSWGYYIQRGYVNTLRCILPFAAQSSFSESTIDYFKKGSIKAILKHLVSKYHVFPFHGMLQNRRKKMWNSMTKYFISVKPSTLCK